MNVLGWASKLAAAGFLAVLLLVTHITKKVPEIPPGVPVTQQQRDAISSVDRRLSELEALHIEAHLAVMESKQDSDGTLLRGIAMAIILMALKDTWGYAQRKRRTEDACAHDGCPSKKGRKG